MNFRTGLRFLAAALVALSLSLSHATAAPGDVDTTFGSDGKGTIGSVNAAAVQADGQIIIAGSFSQVSDAAGTHNRESVVRLNPDGFVDTAFGSDGKGANGGVLATVVQPDGKVIIAGVFTQITDAVGAHNREGIARLNADGSVDATFGSDGKGANGVIFTAALQADGKIIIAGDFTSVTDAVGTTNRNRVARLNPDGSVDTTFGSNGNGTGNIVSAVAVQPDGRVIIAGSFNQITDTVGTHNREGIARLNTDGSVDTAFGSNGNGAIGGIYAATLQADGKVIIAGSFLQVTDAVGTHNRKSIARLNTDGSVDASFGSNSNGAIGGVYVAALQADGRVIIAGDFTSITDTAGTHNRNYVARLGSDGSVDTSFGSDGKGANSSVLSAALQADGKVILAGNFTSVTDAPGTHNRSSFARLENGSATGKLTVPSLSKVKWTRGGTAPEATRVAFEYSTNGGTTWKSLGDGKRITGGWQITGVKIPAKVKVRALAYVVAGGLDGGTSGIVEATATAPKAAGLKDTWTAWYNLANYYYGLYASFGDYNSAFAFYSYYFGLGDYYYHLARKNQGPADFALYNGLALFYLYAYSSNSSYYYYLALAYYYYFLGFGDFNNALLYYNAFIALAS